MSDKSKTKKELIRELEGLRRQLADLLRENGQETPHLVQSLIDSIPNPIFYKDAEGVYRGCNQIFAELVLGLPKDRIVGSSVYDLPEAIPPDLADIYHERDMELIRSPGVQVYEAPVQYTDGTRHQIVFNKSTILGAEGEVAGMVGVMLDVTDRKVVEAERNTLLERTQTLLSKTDALYRLSSKVSQSSNLNEAFRLLVDGLVEILPAHRVALASLDSRRHQAVHVVQSGDGGDAEHTFAFDDLQSGILGWSVREEQPLLLPQAADALPEDPGVRREGAENHFGSLLVVPLHYQDRVLGLLTAANLPEQPDFSTVDLGLAESLAGQAAALFYNDELLAETQRRAERMETAAEVSRAASSTLSLDKLLPRVAKLFYEQFNLCYAGIFLVDETGEFAVLQAGTGEMGQQVVWIDQRLPVGGSSRVGRCITTGEPQITHELVTPDAVVDAPEACSEIVLPLSSRGTVIGALNVQLPVSAGISHDDITFFQAMADQLANAIQNARLFDKAQETLYESELLYRISRSMGAARSIPEMADEIFEIIDFVELNGVLIRVITERGEQKGDLKVDVHGISVVDGERRSVTTPGALAYDALPLLENPREFIIFKDAQDPDAPIPDTVRQYMERHGYRSAMTTGLVARGEILGFLSLSSAEPLTDLPQRYVDVILRTLAEQMAVALDNRLLVDQAQQRAQQLGKLSTLETILSQADTEEELLGAVVQALPEPSQALARLVYVDDVEEEQLEIFAVAVWKNGAIDPQAPTLYQRLPAESTPLAELWMDNPDQVFFISDVQDDPRVGSGLEVLSEINNVRSGVIIPLRSGGRWQGVISVTWPDAQDFTPEDRFVLSNVMKSAAALVARRRSFLEQEKARRASEQRAIQLETAADVARAASSILELDELLPRAVELIRERFSLYYVGLFLVDASGQHAVLEAGTGVAGREMLASHHKFNVGGESMIGACVATGQPQLPERVEDASVRYVNPLLPETQSEIALPLQHRGQVIGAMTVQSTMPNYFSQEDIIVLQTVADQLANAITNARLYADAQARLDELQRLQQRYAVDTWQDYVNETDVAGYTYDLSHLSPLDAFIESLEFAGDNPVTQEGAGDARASLRAPLELRGESVGLLSFEDPETQRDWSDDDVALLNSVREQIALALENRMLFDQSQRALAETRQREAEVRFLQEVAAFLNATEDVVLAQEELLDHLQSFLPVQDVSITLHDVIEGKFWQVEPPDENSFYDEVTRRELGEDSGAAWVIEHDQPWVEDDLREGGRFAESAELRKQNVASRVLLPMKLGTRTLGVFSMTSHEPGAFSRPGAMTSLNQVSAQVASAVERANLLRQTRDALGESQTLYQVSSVLAHATSYEEVLNAIVAHILLSEDTRAEIGFFVQNPETGTTDEWVEIVSGWSSDFEQEAMQVGERLPISELPALEAMGSRDLFIVKDIASTPELDAEMRQFYLKQGVQALVLAPLIVSGRTLGIFQLRFSDPYEPSEQDERLYRIIMEQAAVVLSNRQLLLLSQERAEQLEAAVEMANLTTSILDRETLLEKSATFFQERFDLYYVGIFLLDEEGQWAVLRVGTGSAGEKLLQMGHRLRVSGDSMIGWAVGHAQPRIALNVEKEDVRFENPLLPNTRSEIALPLISRGQVIGALSIQSEERFAFTEDDIATQQLMANQLANVIESTNLYERSQSSLSETSTLYRIAQRVADARTVEDVLRAAVEGISQRSEPDVVVAGLLEPLQDPTALRLVEAWSRDDATKMPLVVYPLNRIRRLYDTLRIEHRFIASDATQDPMVDEFMQEIYRQLGLRAMAVFQLEIRGSQYGTLMIHSKKAREFSTAELRFYENVARQAFVALENLNLVETTQAEAERRAILNEVLQTASSSLDPVGLMRAVSEVIARRLNMPVVVWRWDGKFASPAAIHDAGGKQIEIDEEGTLPEFTLDKLPYLRRPIYDRQMAHIDFELDQNLLPKNMITFENRLVEGVAVPLLARDAILGVLFLGRQVGHPEIDEQEEEFVQTAGINISVALDTARLYQQAQETAEKLKEVDRLKSEFLANMSHELRTPLNSIIGFSKVILKEIDGPLTEMQHTDLTAIYESGQHLLALINDILDISKIEAGKMEFIFEPTDLKEVIRSVLSTAIALVKDKPVKLQSSIPDDLPIVRADNRRLRQVILNLLSNAAKFTSEGYVRVAATYDDYQVIVSVQDTGIGIPPDKMDAVFEQFQQVDSSSTRRYEGTGLGVPLSKRFIELHGGDMWLESQIGEGTTFYFSLPIDGPDAKKEEDEDLLEESSSDIRTVLTVDDDEGVITLFRRYLEKQGYRVIGLTSGDRVVEEAKRLKPYAITLDVIMPDKDGWQVIQDLKADPETRDIPVLICSIVSDSDKGLSMGVSDYLVKPIMEHDLLNALERLERGEDERHVLVVDDNPDDRGLLRRILENAGYDVDAAAGGAEAIIQIHSDPPDLIVLDLMMPEVDGFAVLENLKMNESTRHIPIVVVTAKELGPEERMRLQQRVQALLQKGLFDQEQLLRDVSDALDRIAMNNK